MSKSKHEAEISSESSSEEEEDNVILTKRTRSQVDEDDVQDTDSDNNDEDEEDEQEEISNMDFDFCDPSDGDFHYVKTFLQQSGLAGIPSFAEKASDVADAIVEQKAVGTMIKVSDVKEDVYSMATLLGLKEHRENPGVQVFVEHLKKTCPANKKDTLDTVLSGKKGGVAWLVNERILNVPSQLAPPLHKCLLEDRAWTVKNLDEAGATKGQFDFKYVVLFAPLINPEGAPSEGESSSSSAASKTKKKGNKKQKVEQTSTQDDYYKFEEEFFRNNSMLCFPSKLSFPIPEGEGAIPQSNKPKKAYVLVLKYENYAKAVKSLQKVEF